MKKKTIVLFDGNAIVHRAYHALPPLSTSDGTLVNAVYGFSATLLSVLEKFKPEYAAASFDLSAPTFRHKAYEQYKATRVKAPDELYVQIPMAKEVVQAFGIPIYEMQGFEADDVVGTIARKAEREGMKVIIVTGDMDTLQLVTENISVFAMRKGVRDTVLYDVSEVVKKYGFLPKYIPDFKGLRGDPSDNIPGVKGIGEKTATELLRRFETLECIYEHIREIKDSVREKLENEKEMAVQSKMLGTICTNVPVDVNFEKCEIPEKSKETAQNIFRKLEFFSLAKRISGSSSSNKKVSLKKKTMIEKGNCKKVNKNEAEEIFQEIMRRGLFAFAIDWNEDTQTHEKKIRGVAVSFETGRGAYVNFSDIISFDKEKNVFFSPVQKIGYDIKSLLRLFWKEKIFFDCENIADILLMAYLLQEGTDMSLEHLMFSTFGEEVRFSSEQGSFFGDSQDEALSPREQRICEKAIAVFRLFSFFKVKMDRVSASQIAGKTLWDVWEKIEKPLVPVLARMEDLGVQLDTTIFSEISEKIVEKIRELEEVIYELAGGAFNINSTKQLREVLFDRLCIPTRDIKKTKTGYSTASSELQKIQGTHKIAGKIEEYRELFKLKTTYIDILPKLADRQGRIHTTFNQAVTATGRLSSSDPNIQNIPIRTEIGRMLRYAFVATSGYRFLSADYSQIDLRCAAHLSADVKMREAFFKGEDIHTLTASEVFGVSSSKVSRAQRRQAKVLNFGVLYGMGTFGFSNAAQVNRVEAQAFIDAYKEKFSGLAKYLDTIKAFAREKGYVETECGRRRYIPEIQSSNFQISAAGERMAINLPIQGLTADIMKLAMIAADALAKHYDGKVRMILQIHDELIFEVTEDVEEEFSKKIKNVMETIYPLSVPLVVDVAVGASWGDL